MTFQLYSCQQAVIIGAGHGIGFALAQDLLKKYPKINITATYRVEHKAVELIDLSKQYPNHLQLYQLDPTEELAIRNFSSLFEDKSIDLLINSVGLLHSDQLKPEKSLKDFDPDAFHELIRVNTLVTPLLAKYFEKKLSKSPSLFATISAKVGSIEDNRIGGWYSYRVSKAALNMFLKNIAIEFERKRLNCIVFSIHPGTTKTELSKPFIEKTSYVLHEPHESAINILNLIDKRELDETGKFLSWNGEEIPW